MTQATRFTTLAVVLALGAGAFTPAFGQAGGQALGPEQAGGIFADAPEGFIPPPLHPGGVTLETRRLGEGVYALMSDKPPTDNSGFIVGEDAVLVIDAHINPEMAGQIIESVRRVTDKPIAYLVNTNYHGDHTFGNSTFPSSTTIIAHAATGARMADFEGEWRVMLVTVSGDTEVLEGVTLRLPDITFDERLTIDLGGRVVELYHFGAGNTPGDTVVYEPLTRTAWTGNLVIMGSAPPIFESDAATYLRTISAFASELDVETIIPGHGVQLDGAAQLAVYQAYLGDLLTRVRQQVREGRSLEQALEGVPLEDRWLPEEGSALSGIAPLMRGFHRLNVKRTYEALAGDDAR